MDLNATVRNAPCSSEAQKGISKRACSKDLTLRSQPLITMAKPPETYIFRSLFAAYGGCGQYTADALNIKYLLKRT